MLRWYNRRLAPNATYFTQTFVIMHVWHAFCALMAGYY